MRCDVRARRVREEVTAFRPERIDGPNDLQNWQRLRNVLLEALRLYPPIPQIIRVANGPDEICGEKIGANTQVWISSWVMRGNILSARPGTNTGAEGIRTSDLFGAGGRGLDDGAAPVVEDRAESAPPDPA